MYYMVCDVPYIGNWTVYKVYGEQNKGIETVWQLADMDHFIKEAM